MLRLGVHFVMLRSEGPWTWLACSLFVLHGLQVLMHLVGQHDALALDVMDLILFGQLKDRGSLVRRFLFGVQIFNDLSKRKQEKKTKVGTHHQRLA